MLLNPRWTDLCLVVGPNMRWALEDTVDLYRQMPEVLLGYRVKPITVHQIIGSGVMRGSTPSKIVVLEASRAEYNWATVAWPEIQMLRTIYGTKVECWFVHRARGIWRIW